MAMLRCAKILKTVPQRSTHVLSPCGKIKAPNTHLMNLTQKCVSFIPNFISKTQQNSLVQEIDNNFKKLLNQNYNPDHWDRAIKQYRERELELGQFENETNNEIIERIDDELVKLSGAERKDILSKIHFLDLGEGGEIFAHVDSVKFCGAALASLSLVLGLLVNFIFLKFEIFHFFLLIFIHKKHSMLYI